MQSPHPYIGSHNDRTGRGHGTNPEKQGIDAAIRGFAAAEGQRARAATAASCRNSTARGRKKARAGRAFRGHITGIANEDDRSVTVTDLSNSPMPPVL
jgi:hypothetical protein